MFIDAKLIDNEIWLSERNKNGVRTISKNRPPYVFYYSDSAGIYKALDGMRAQREQHSDRKKFYNSIRRHRENDCEIYESDVPVEFRFLEERYQNDDPPDLHISFIDIEVSKHPKLGWAKPPEPHSMINAITIYNKWADFLVTIAIPPSAETRVPFRYYRDMLDEDTGDGFGKLSVDENVILVETEAELLTLFLEIIEDADVLTGWNSEYYDLPYLIQRIRVALGNEDYRSFKYEEGTEDAPVRYSAESCIHLRKLCLFDKLPTMIRIEKFGKWETTFDIHGRVHLDYLKLYRKFNQEPRHSHTLDNILQVEVKQAKVSYPGTLDQLYKNDFRRYVAYNRQDVAGLTVLDKKRRMIELANTMVHFASVTFDRVFGSVAIIEQAIMKHHHKKRVVFLNKKEHDIEEKIPGGFVVEPDGGLFEYGTVLDIESLYPTIMIMNNISVEKIVGQFQLPRTDALLKHRMKVLKQEPSEAWRTFTGVFEYHDIIEENDIGLTFVFEDGDELTLPAKEWKTILRENNWCLSANGTVFDQSSQGVVTECLITWFADRIIFKREAGEFKKKMTEAKEAKNKTLEAEYETQFRYYDMVQNVKKVFLNATYGASLNVGYRFYDIRCGKSTTLGGRVTLKHMCKFVCEQLTGNYDFDRRALIYGDTDSNFTSLKWYMEQHGIEPTVENMVEIADDIAKKVNASFPRFAADNFLISEEMGKRLKAKRESVFSRGLFKNAKKRYALAIVNDDGMMLKEPKIKITGMEIKRSDTPKYIQEFLLTCVTRVLLEDDPKADIMNFIRDFREDFRKREPWFCGSPSSVSKLTMHMAEEDAFFEERSQGYDVKLKARHFAVTAGKNTNRLMELFNEKRWDYIEDGDKIEILYLHPNNYKMRQVAIKVGETYVPDWFKTLPFAFELHEEKMIDRKLENILGILGWDFAESNQDEDPNADLYA